MFYDELVKLDYSEQFKRNQNGYYEPLCTQDNDTQDQPIPNPIIFACGEKDTAKEPESKVNRGHYKPNANMRRKRFNANR